MIKSGVKKEEYREIKGKWISILCNIENKNCISNKYSEFGINGVFKHFDKVVFTLGYPSESEKERILEFDSPRISIRQGKQEWGAKKDTNYFVITWRNKND